jgi:hypothetical protein
MEKAKVLEICKRIAPAFKFDPLLILAICEQESSYNEHAIRFEPKFYRRYVEPGDRPPSAELLLSFSYGLMQTMGLTLDEQGYFVDCELAGDYASAIDRYFVDPELQIEQGCTCLKRKQGDKGTLFALLRYNGGGNPQYPQEVMARFKKLEMEFA